MNLLIDSCSKLARQEMSRVCQLILPFSTACLSCLLLEFSVTQLLHLLCHTGFCVLSTTLPEPCFACCGAHVEICNCGYFCEHPPWLGSGSSDSKSQIVHIDTCFTPLVQLSSIAGPQPCDIAHCQTVPMRMMLNMGTRMKADSILTACRHGIPDMSI